MLPDQFIIRGQAIRLYRDMLRECRKIEPVPSRELLKRWIREEFENARYLRDEVLRRSSSVYPIHLSFEAKDLCCQYIHTIRTPVTCSRFVLSIHTAVQYACNNGPISLMIMSACVFFACRPAFMRDCLMDEPLCRSCGVVWP